MLATLFGSNNGFSGFNTRGQDDLDLLSDVTDGTNGISVREPSERGDGSFAVKLTGSGISGNGQIVFDGPQAQDNASDFQDFIDKLATRGELDDLLDAILDGSLTGDALSLAVFAELSGPTTAIGNAGTQGQDDLDLLGSVNDGTNGTSVTVVDDAVSLGGAGIGGNGTVVFENDDDAALFFQVTDALAREGELDDALQGNVEPGGIIASAVSASDDSIVDIFQALLAADDLASI